MIDVFRFNYETEAFEVIASFDNDKIAEAGEFARLEAEKEGLQNATFTGGGGKIQGDYSGGLHAPYYGIAKDLYPSAPRVPWPPQ